MLEDSGYKVSTHTDGDWEVTTPRGDVIMFKRDTGVCKGMPYIDLRDHREDQLMVETVNKNLEMFPRRRSRERSSHVQYSDELGTPQTNI